MFMFLDITVCCGLFAILLLRYSDFFYIVFFFFLPPHLLSLLFLCVLFSFFFFFFFHPWYTIASWFMIVFLIPPLLCDSIPSGVLLKHEDGVCLKVRKWDTQFHNFLWKAKKKLSEISTTFWDFSSLWRLSLLFQIWTSAASQSFCVSTDVWTLPALSPASVRLDIMSLRTAGVVKVRRWWSHDH